MSKHTPGPWKANLYLGGAYAIEQTAPNGDRLGRIAVVDGMIPTKSNARLMAAAPELLEALKTMAAQHYCGCGHASCKRCADDRMCYDVIAKAEGKY